MRYRWKGPGSLSANGKSFAAGDEFTDEEIPAAESLVKRELAVRLDAPAPAPFVPAPTRERAPILPPPPPPVAQQPAARGKAPEPARSNDKAKHTKSKKR